MISDDEENLSFLLSNNTSYFEIFFNIMNLELAELSTKTWNLLCNIPVNKNIFEKIKFINKSV